MEADSKWDNPRFVLHPPFKEATSQFYENAIEIQFESFRITSHAVEFRRNQMKSAASRKINNKKGRQASKVIKSIEVLRSPWIITNWKTRFNRLNDMAIKNMIHIYSTFAFSHCILVSSRNTSQFTYISMDMLVWSCYESMGRCVNVVASSGAFNLLFSIRFGYAHCLLIRFLFVLFSWDFTIS